MIGVILGHVALSTGVMVARGHSEVITFAEGLMSVGPARVNRSTIKALGHGYQPVHFLQPDWTYWCSVQ